MFSQCCEPYLLEKAVPPTAVALMRSRYSAYVMHNEDYLLTSWHPSTRPAQLNLQTTSPQWIGLKIVHCEHGTEHDSQGMVEFIARYKVNGKAHRLHEQSRFVREAGRWYYLEGEMQE